MSGAREHGGGGWGLVAFLMALYTFGFIDRAIIGLLVEPIKADLQLSDTQFSLLAGPAFIVFYAAAGVPLGWLADRWSRRNLIAIGVALWSLATAAGGLASSAAQLFAARVGVGVGEATLSPSTYSLLSDRMPPRRLAVALSVFAMGVPIGSGLAALIGGPLIHALTQSMGEDGWLKPWQAVFMIVGLPGLLLALLTLLIVREPARAPIKREDQADARAIVAYLKANWRVYVPLFCGISMMNLFVSGAAAWYPALLQRVHGLDIREAGLLIGSTTLVLGVGGSLFAGWLAGRHFLRGKLDAHFRVGLLYAVLLLLCGAIGPIVPDATLSLVMIGLAACFSMTWVGVNAAALQLVTPERMRGRVSAVYQAVGSLIGAGIGPTLVALSTDKIFGDDHAVGWSLALVGTLSLSLSVLLLHLGRKPLARLIAARIGT